MVMCKDHLRAIAGAYPSGMQPWRSEVWAADENQGVIGMWVGLKLL